MTPLAERMAGLAGELSGLAQGTGKVPTKRLVQQCSLEIGRAHSRQAGMRSGWRDSPSQRKQQGEPLPKAARRIE